MKTFAVSSSSISRVGYDQLKHILRVDFLDGDAYYYLQVPARIFAQMMRSPSKGAFLNMIVKPSYEFVRL